MMETVVSIVIASWFLLGLIMMSCLEKRNRNLSNRLQQALDARGTVVIHRDKLIAMISRVYRKQNPGEPEPDWLIVAQSAADYENGDWRTADEVLEELEANDGQRIPSRR